MSEKKTVLIIDDEQRIRNLLADILRLKGYQALTAEDGESGLEILNRQAVEVVLLDLMLPKMDGLEVLKKIRDHNRSIQTIMITAHGSVSTAVEAIKAGAYDYIEKPLDADKILVLIKNALEKAQLLGENLRLRGSIIDRYKMVGNSAAMQKIYRQIKILAPQTCTVLIGGETGTGKELVARSLHNLSHRISGPFVKVNCAAIPKDLIESELFGHRKGAFTGALTDMPGRFEQADGGTIFLDEIGDLPVNLQAKLLQVLEEKTFFRLGDTQERQVDVRVLAATNKDLKAGVEINDFRADLFYRLNMTSIHLPPLRDHAEDIPYLIKYFIALLCDDMNRSVPEITPNALHVMMDHNWPGNVRQLKHKIQEMLIYLQANTLDAGYMRDWLSGVSDHDKDMHSTKLRSARENFERDYIRNALIAHDWDVPKTADYLGIERTNLYRKMKGLGLGRD